jgi:hypothetical protein
MGSRWSLAGGGLAATQMTVFVTVAGETRPGYDPSRNWVSQLALGPGGWLAALNLGICGFWLLLCAHGLGRNLSQANPISTYAVRLVTFCGACLVMIAMVRTDPGIGYPPDVPAAHTVLGILHQVISVALGFAGIAAAATLGRCLPEARWAASTGRAVAALMTVTFVSGSILVLLDAGGVLPRAPSGFLERVALFAGLAWFGVVSTLLLLRPVAGHSRPDPRLRAAPRSPGDPAAAGRKQRRQGRR